LMFYPMIKMDMVQKKLDPANPEQVNAAFKKMLPGKGDKKIPFTQVNKVVKLVQSNGQWFVSTGWKEAADAMVEYAAKNQIEIAKNMARYDEGIKKLQDLKLKVPNSKVIADGLALLERCVSGMDKIVIAASDPLTGQYGGKEITIDISNKSDMKLKSLVIQFTLLDSKGNVLRTMDGFPLNAEYFDPAAPNGCAPGYTGKIKNVQSTSETELIEKWAKTTLKLKSVFYVF
jgi:hypothetical protein